MAAQTKLSIVAQGVNNTKQMFMGIKGNVKSIGDSFLSISSIVTTPFKVASEAVNTLRDQVKELSKYNSLSIQTGATTEELSKLATALKVLVSEELDVNKTSELLNKMYQKTGTSGLEGFQKVITYLAGITDKTQQAAETTRIFGDAGAKLLPLIGSLKQTGTDAFQLILHGLNGISQKSASAGASMNDAMILASEGVRNSWLSTIGEITASLSNDFPGGAQASALAIAAYTKYGFDVALSYVKSFSSNGSLSLQSFKDSATNIFVALSEAAGAVFDSIGSGLTDSLSYRLESWGFAIQAIKAKITGDKEAEDRYKELMLQADADREAASESTFVDRVKKRLADLSSDKNSATYKLFHVDLSEANEALASSLAEIPKVVSNINEVKKGIEAEIKKSAGAQIVLPPTQATTPEKKEEKKESKTLYKPSLSGGNEFVFGGTYKSLTMGMKQANYQTTVQNCLKKIETLVSKISNNESNAATVIGSF